MPGWQQGSCHSNIAIHRETKTKNRSTIRIGRLKRRSSCLPKLREITAAKVVIHQRRPRGEAVINLNSLMQKLLGIVQFLFHLGAKGSTNPETGFPGTELSRRSEFIVRIESGPFAEFAQERPVLRIFRH